MDKRLLISAVLYPIVQSVLFGTALVAIISAFGADGTWLLPHAALMSLVMAAPTAWELAPLMSFELARTNRQDRRRH